MKPVLHRPDVQPRFLVSMAVQERLNLSFSCLSAMGYAEDYSCGAVKNGGLQVVLLQVGSFTVSTFIRDSQQAATGTEEGDIIMWEPFMKATKPAAKSPAGAPSQVSAHGVQSCCGFGISCPARAQTHVWAESHIAAPLVVVTFMPYHATMT